MRTLVNLKKKMMKRNFVIKINMIAKAANLLKVEKIPQVNNQDNQSLKISKENNKTKLLKTQKFPKKIKILIYDNLV